MRTKMTCSQIVQPTMLANGQKPSMRRCGNPAVYMVFKGAHCKTVCGLHRNSLFSKGWQPLTDWYHDVPIGSTDKLLKSSGTIASYYVGRREACAEIRAALHKYHVALEELDALGGVQVKMRAVLMGVHVIVGKAERRGEVKEEL